MGLTLGLRRHVISLMNESITTAVKREREREIEREREREREGEGEEGESEWRGGER